MSSPQPWTRPDGHLPPDRAYFDDLFDRWAREENEREERLRHYLQWLIVRWALISAFITLFIALVWQIAERIMEGV
jgi:hypothetical protein